MFHVGFPLQRIRIRIDIEQALDAGAREQVLSERIHNVGNDAGNAAGNLIAVLEKAHLIEQVADFFFQQIFQLPDQDAALVVVVILLAAARFLGGIGYDSAHVNRVGLDFHVANQGAVVDIQYVDRHADAHAHGAAGGGGVGLDFRHGAVKRNHVHRAVHILLIRMVAVFGLQLRIANRRNGNLRVTAVQQSLGAVLLDVQHKARGHADAALAGLRLLAVGVCAHHVGGGRAFAAVHLGQAGCAAHHFIGLLIGFSFAVAALRAFRAGGGGALDRALGFRADIHAVGHDAAAQLRAGAVADNTDAKAAAHSRFVPGGSGVRADGMGGFSAREHDQFFHRTGFFQVFLLVQAEQFALAQISLGIGTRNIQRQRRRDRYAARGTGLAGNGVRYLLRRNHVEVAQALAARDHRDILAVLNLFILNRGHGVRPGHSDGQARAYAGSRGFFRAGSVRLGIEGGGGVGLYIDRAANGDCRVVHDFGVGLSRRHIDADSAADTDIARGIARGGFHGGFRFLGVGLHGHAFNAFNRAALDQGVILAAHDAHRHGYARADGGGFGVVRAQLKVRGYGDGSRVRRSLRNREAVGAVVVSFAKHGGFIRLAVHSGLDDRFHRAVLGSVALIRRYLRRQDPVFFGVAWRGDRTVGDLAVCGHQNGELCDGGVQLQGTEIKARGSVLPCDGERSVAHFPDLECNLYRFMIFIVRFRGDFGDIVFVRIGG